MFDGGEGRLTGGGGPLGEEEGFGFGFGGEFNVATREAIGALPLVALTGPPAPAPFYLIIFNYLFALKIVK